MKNQFLPLLAVFMLLTQADPAMAGWRDWFKSKEQQSSEVVYGLVNSRRQQTIERYHLLAHAQSVEVLGSVLADSQWTPLTKSSSAQPTILVVEYIIRWAGPINKGGMTRLVSAYDLTRSDIPVLQEGLLSTNGTTNNDAAYSVGAVLGALFGDEQ